MGIIFVLLLLFMGIGLFARQYDTRVRVVISAIIAGMLLFLYLT